LNNLLDKVETKHGRFDPLAIWCDNTQGQFKECLVFYLNHLVKKEKFRRIDLKFPLEGHLYLICNRQFGCIQKFFYTVERIEASQDWATLLKKTQICLFMDFSWILASEVKYLCYISSTFSHTN